MSKNQATWNTCIYAAISKAKLASTFLPQIEVNEIIERLEKLRDVSQVDMYLKSAPNKGRGLQDWIRVEDRPKATGEYYCYDPNLFGKNKQEVFRYDEYNNHWSWGGDGRHPTHWRPLFDPPESKREGGKQK